MCHVIFLLLRKWVPINNIDPSMIVTMSVMHVMQSPIYQKIEMVKMGYQFMTTIFVMVMMATHESGFAAVRVGGRYGYRVIVNMILMVVMEVVVMEVVNMVLMCNCGVPTSCPMLMWMVTLVNFMSTLVFFQISISYKPFPASLTITNERFVPFVNSLMQAQIRTTRKLPLTTRERAAVWLLPGVRSHMHF